MSERRTYTVDEVAELLGLARGTAYARVRDGSIPARQMGRRWVISRASFDAWLNDANGGV
jgi:excisionase family DNA binding protein